MRHLPTDFETFKGIAKLEKLGVKITLTAESEDRNIFDQFDDEKTAQKIADKYNSGNEWAWFCAHVEVEYRGYKADDYLGGCSYKSEQDFKRNSGYFIDMVKQCVDEINKDIAAHNKEIQKYADIRLAKKILKKHGLLVAAAI